MAIILNISILAFSHQILLAAILGSIPGWTFAELRLPMRSTFYIAPTIEGLLTCDKGLNNSNLKSIEQVSNYCIEHQLDAAASVNRLLDQLEPGGPKGQVQIGYVATLQLLGLFKRQGKEWIIDNKKLDIYLQLLTRVKRPVVVYLAADHFDSQGALVDGLLQDPKNLMLLKNGQPAMANYFGYRIAPYTLQTDEDIAVNFYRFSALRYVVKKLRSLPQAAQKRIIAVTLPGELHHMFADFEGGTGRYEDIQVTDYSAASIAGFRQWLATKYKNINTFNTWHNTQIGSFDEIPAPTKDLRKNQLKSVTEHYDAYAAGSLPIAGWLWDPQKRVTTLDLYIDGKRVGPIEQGFNRLDVYRAVTDVTNPNVGYRHDLDFSQFASGTYLAQVVATADKVLYLLGQVSFTANLALNQPKAQIPQTPTGLNNLQPAHKLAGIKTSLDLPKANIDVYFNPLARDWNQYRAWQVRHFMEHIYQIARESGLPANKIYSHQIFPNVNSAWNPQLFAVEKTIADDVPWQVGINLYGGATDSNWVRHFLAQNKIVDYGVPEFNPQQWKRQGAHLDAMRSHYTGGARFISPYYLSIVPHRYRQAFEYGVGTMELQPGNTKEGSNQFYHAIREFAGY